MKNWKNWLVLAGVATAFAFLGFMEGAYVASSRYKAHDKWWVFTATKGNFLGCMIGITAQDDPNGEPQEQEIEYCKSEAEHFGDKLIDLVNKGE